MTDDLGEFRAPPFQKPTPAAVKLAGARLMKYALDRDIPRDVAICDMAIPDDVEQAEELRKAQRLLRWFVSLS